MIEPFGLTLFQWLVIASSIFVVSRIILRAKDQKIKLYEFIFWMFIWLTLIISSFFPDLITKVANFIGVGRGVDVIIYISIGTLFYLIFRLYVKLEESQQELTVIVRELAYLKKKK
jgi:hypothetical protein